MTPRVLMLTADYVPGAWSGIGHAVATRCQALAALGVGVDVLLPAGHPALFEYPPPSGGGGLGSFGPRTEGVSRAFAAPVDPSPESAAGASADKARLSDRCPPTSRLRRASAGRDLPPAEASEGQQAAHASAVRRPSPQPGETIHPLDCGRLPVDPASYDVVHLHSLPLAELALEMRRRFGVPLVYTAHSQLGLELGGSPQAGMWQRLQETVMGLADHVVVPSRSERAAALAHLPGIGRKVTVVPHGVRSRGGIGEPEPRCTVSMCCPPAASAGGRSLPAEALRSREVGGQLPPRRGAAASVVFAGRFTRSKGIDIVATLARWLAEVRPDLTVVVAGGHGDEAENGIVADLAADHPATVVAPGWLPPAALRRLFAGAGVVVVPSRYEPFGMVALEAMAEGAPVLAAAVGGLVDIVTPRSGGALVDSHDPERWLSEVLALLDDPRRTGVLRERGPQHVAAHHDPLSLAATLRDDVYLPLLSPGRGVSDVA